MVSEEFNKNNEEKIEDNNIDMAEGCKEDDVEKELEETDKKFDALQESFIRLQADFTNFRRRTESEKAEYIEIGVSKVITNLLPIVDNFERALENKEDTKFYEGVEMIYTQIRELLENNGVEEIKALNEKFDPNFHHAVFAEEVEGVEEDTVTEVLQKGYKLGEKVLRPSMVKVSK